MQPLHCAFILLVSGFIHLVDACFPTLPRTAPFSSVNRDTLRSLCANHLSPSPISQSPPIRSEAMCDRRHTCVNKRCHLCVALLLLCLSLAAGIAAVRQSLLFTQGCPLLAISAYLSRSCFVLTSLVFFFE